MAFNTTKLSTYPLFLGIPKPEMMEIATTTPLIHRYHKRGSTIVNEGTECDSVVMILNGWFEMTTYSDNKSFSLVETLYGPHFVEPEKLYGKKHTYTSTYVATTGCESLTIKKAQLQELCAKHLIVRLNFFNTLCRNTQRFEKMRWTHTPEKLKDAIADFVRKHSIYPWGKKVLRIKMIDLANELNTSRQSISDALRQLEDEERIIVQRGIITIPELKLLENIKALRESKDIIEYSTPREQDNSNGNDEITKE